MIAKWITVWLIWCHRLTVDSECRTGEMVSFIAGSALEPWDSCFPTGDACLGRAERLGSSRNWRTSPNHHWRCAETFIHTPPHRGSHYYPFGGGGMGGLQEPHDSVGGCISLRVRWWLTLSLSPTSTSTSHTCCPFPPQWGATKPGRQGPHTLTSVLLWLLY